MLLLQLALEKEELRIHLQASKDAQRQLTAEVDTRSHTNTSKGTVIVRSCCFNNSNLCVVQLNELADRNAECVEMLHESQEEIKELRNKNTPSAGLRRHLSYGLYPMVRDEVNHSQNAAVLCSS